MTMMFTFISVTLSSALRVNKNYCYLIITAFWLFKTLFNFFVV